MSCNNQLKETMGYLSAENGVRHLTEQPTRVPIRQTVKSLHNAHRLPKKMSMQLSQQHGKHFRNGKRQQKKNVPQSLIRLLTA